MENKYIYAGIFGAVLALSGCSGSVDTAEVQPDPVQGSAPTAQTPTPTPTPLPETDSPSLVTADTGQRIVLNNAVGEKSAYLTVTDIAVNQNNCTFGNPDNVVVLSVTVQTLDTASHYTVGNSFMWKYVTPDGVTKSVEPMFSCLGSGSSLPSGQKPNTKYAGKVAFDVPNPHGAMKYSPVMSSNAVKWEF